MTATHWTDEHHGAMCRGPHTLAQPAVCVIDTVPYCHDCARGMTRNMRRPLLGSSTPNDDAREVYLGMSMKPEPPKPHSIIDMHAPYDFEDRNN